jgi:hypothetical protein
MVLGQFSDICGYGDPQISENWPRTIRATVSTISANIRKLAKDHKGYGFHYIRKYQKTGQGP